MLRCKVVFMLEPKVFFDFPAHCMSFNRLKTMFLAWQCTFISEGFSYACFAVNRHELLETILSSPERRIYQRQQNTFSPKVADFVKTIS